MAFVLKMLLNCWISWDSGPERGRSQWAAFAAACSSHAESVYICVYEYTRTDTYVYTMYAQ